MRRGGIAIIEAPGAISATATLQRQDTAGNIVDATDNSGTVITFTKAGTYTINPNNVAGMYRLNMKAGAYISGQPITMKVEGQ